MAGSPPKPSEAGSVGGGGAKERSAVFRVSGKQNEADFAPTRPRPTRCPRVSSSCWANPAPHSGGPAAGGIAGNGSPRLKRNPIGIAGGPGLCPASLFLPLKKAKAFLPKRGGAGRREGVPLFQTQEGEEIDDETANPAPAERQHDF